MLACHALKVLRLIEKSLVLQIFGKVLDNLVVLDVKSRDHQHEYDSC